MEAIDSDMLGQLLEWSPTIIANEHTVDFLFAKGIKVDIVFTDTSEVYTQEQINILPLKEDFLIAALNYLIAKNYKAVNIICDTLDNRLIAACKQINLVLLTPGKRTVFVKTSYEKWIEKGRRVYVEEQYLKSLVGLQKIATDQFETEQDGFFQLSFNSSEFIAVGEDL